MLTDIACKKASCPTDKKRARHTDSGNLYLEVSANNKTRRWFWKFSFGGKEKRLALGSYPTVSLKAARLARDAARKVHQDGIDPVQRRQLDKLSNQATAAVTFEAVARAFHKVKAPSWSPSYSKRWISLMEKDAFPWLGKLPLSAITAPILLHVLRRVEARGAHESAHTLLQWCGQTFRYGIVTGGCERNPAPDLQGALVAIGTRHMSAVVEPSKAGELMRAMDSYAGQPVTRAALVLSALLFQRPGNIRHMRWCDVNLEGKGLWTIPAADMKRTLDGKLNGQPHLVPLARQAVTLLEDLRPLTGYGEYVFPSMLGGKRPMSDNTVRTALRRMGYAPDEMSAHGFRAMARTIMVERLGVDEEVIEVQLAHGKKGPLGKAYNRAEYVEQRRGMMQVWADHLDALRAGGEVVALKKRA